MEQINSVEENYQKNYTRAAPITYCAESILNELISSCNTGILDGIPNLYNPKYFAFI